MSRNRAPSGARTTIPGTKRSLITRSELLLCQVSVVVVMDRRFRVVFCLPDEHHLLACPDSDITCLASDSKDGQS